MRSGNRAGFTLIELIVVMLVLSAVAAVTVPAFLNAPVEDDLTIATRRMEALFRVARDSAARSGKRVSVVVDSVTGRVWFDVAGVLPTEAQLPVTRTTRPSAIAEPMGEDLELPGTVSIELTAMRATFSFAPTGGVFGDSLLLVSSLGTRVVKANPWTGDILVY
jgi:prepilin-type N-terminal cleavage/methylation domain-containing protein